jgi:hypothetical protein
MEKKREEAVTRPVTRLIQNVLQVMTEEQERKRSLEKNTG